MKTPANNTEPLPNGGDDLAAAREVPITPFEDQRPGTSGLRKTTQRFRTPNYLEAFVQSIFDVQPITGPMVLGGDGRFFGSEAAQTIVSLAVANGAERIVVGRDALLSTPAASHLVRQRSAWGALVLSASHNPGGPEGDFGVKFNGANGAPAPEAVTEAIFERSRSLTSYRTAGPLPIDLSTIGEQRIGRTVVEVVDPAAAYADLMEQLFDFGRISSLLKTPRYRMVFDAMHAVTGPYAREIFERRLGAADVVLRGDPLPDFGGGHPDPTPANAKRLTSLMFGASPPDFGAASDGDGDRHLVMGPRFVVNASDSLAVLLANAELVPGYAGRVRGVARSMPTSRAVDVVAERLGLPCFETPTGWKYFGSLLDAGRITFCGEESAGAGSDHVREKDGVWAVLYWLNLVAARGQGVAEIVADHWAQYGRHAAQRLDFEGLPSDGAAELMDRLRRSLGDLPGADLGGRTVETCDDFDYVDPVSGATSRQQGVRLFLADGGRIVFRLSGTGTSGATLRVYLDQYVTAPDLHVLSAQALTLTLEQAALAALTRADASFMAGRLEPTHRT